MPNQPLPENVNRANQARFYGILGGNKTYFECAGLTAEKVKSYYRRRYGVESLSSLSPEQWAIAAAEVAAMRENTSILSQRAGDIFRFKGVIGQ